jgi:hypothetical protein
MAGWWKCQITGKDKIPLQFNKGDIVFIKKGEEFIILYDGKKRGRIPKSALKNIKLLSRLDPHESGSLERRYQFKYVPASSFAWDPSTIRD